MGDVMYLKKNKEMMDPETGEVETMECLIRLWSGDRKFVKVFDAFLMDIILNKRLSGKAIRLLFYISQRLPYNEDTVYLIPEDVTRELEISMSTYKRWLKDLIDTGILKRRARNVYQIQPYAFVRGSMVKTLNI